MIRIIEPDLHSGVCRVMAHAILCGGRLYKGLHVAEYRRGNKEIRLYPCECELHSTLFFNGAIEVDLEGDKMIVTEGKVPVSL